MITFVVQKLNQNCLKSTDWDFLLHITFTGNAIASANICKPPRSREASGKRTSVNTYTHEFHKSILADFIINSKPLTNSPCRGYAL